jgi:putative serine protease PepD
MDEDLTPDRGEERTTERKPVEDVYGVPSGARRETASGPALPPQRRRRHWTTAAVIVAGIVGGLIGALATTLAVTWALGVGPFEPEPTEPAAVAVDIDGDVSPVVDIADQVVPSVVAVTVYELVRTPAGMAYREFGSGSGVVYRADGYIITNQHVITGADRVTVGIGVEDVDAEVVGSDPSTDLAVLKVERTGLPVPEFGDSAGLRVGEIVVAVGSPFGLDKTITAGIISALSRSTLTIGASDVTAYTNLIQTDAAINPGNSGGALADEDGRVIGINTLIESPSGSVGAPQSAGIGFAIPADFAIEAARQLIDAGCVVHPYLGVTTVTLDPSTIASFGLPVEAGALVQRVTPESPADVAGMERNDIVVAIDDEPVEGFADVFTAVRAHEIGEIVEVEVVRGDETVTLDVELGSEVCE